ncbi:MAG: M20 family metallo-hydrolase [Anaerocolumna sp.]
MKINIERLERNLFNLAKIGKNETGGIDRALGSEEDREARKWLINYWKGQTGMPVRIDAVANMWVRREGGGDEPGMLAPIVLGSHHDAVPNGGMYDGALGVLAATEVLQTLIDHNIQTRHPIEVVSFTGEEPNPYNVSTLGSKVLSGRLKKTDLQQLKSVKDNSSLADCIEKIGGNIELADNILIKPGDISAFMELHIEQGKRLYSLQESSANVTCITGIYRENITVLGDANHGGTTIMQDRQDALLAASELNLEFEKILKKINSPEVVGTIGYLVVYPNAVSNIPGKVELVLEIRTCISGIVTFITDKLTVIAKKIEERRKVTIDRKVNLDQQAMPMDETVQNAIRRGIKSLELPVYDYVSMAGHDAANMQRVTRAGMIFTQSVDGKSHCPGERTRIEDIGRTVNAMLAAVLILDKELDL